jgi:hypothetical protein
MRDSQPFGGAVQALVIGPWTRLVASSQAPACIAANYEHMQLRLLLPLVVLIRHGTSLFTVPFPDNLSVPRLPEPPPG